MPAEAGRKSTFGTCVFERDAWNCARVIRMTCATLSLRSATTKAGRQMNKPNLDAACALISPEEREPMAVRSSIPTLNSAVSPSAWLRPRPGSGRAGIWLPVPISVASLPSVQVAEADLVAFYLPMHTATRLAVPALEHVRSLNPTLIFARHGLYAPLNESYLRQLGVQSIVGVIVRIGLARLADALEPVSQTSLERLTFLVPDRTNLPVLSRYPKLILDSGKRRVGYTEASRGCKHLCRHCPIVPVYNGNFRIVQPEIVLEDIRRQIAAGAQHITFGDPDFLNGPKHAKRILEQIHSEFPFITYDFTAKIEHLLAQPELILSLKDTGRLICDDGGGNSSGRYSCETRQGSHAGGFHSARPIYFVVPVLPLRLRLFHLRLGQRSAVFVIYSIRFANWGLRKTLRLYSGAFDY